MAGNFAPAIRNTSRRLVMARRRVFLQETPVGAKAGRAVEIGPLFQWHWNSIVIPLLNRTPQEAMEMTYAPRQVFRWKDPSTPPQMPALAIYFEPTPVVNDEVTRATGKQTYDDVLIAYVAPIGQPKSEASHEIRRTLPDGTVKVNHHYAAKYAEPLRHYDAGAEAETLGTPLRDLIGMTPAVVMNLKARGIHTIEMLAEAPDAAGSETMGFWQFRDTAKRHIENREKEAPTKRLESELAARDATIATMQRQIDELASRLAPEKPTKKAA